MENINVNIENIFGLVNIVVTLIVLPMIYFIWDLHKRIIELTLKSVRHETLIEGSRNQRIEDKEEERRAMSRLTEAMEKLSDKINSLFSKDQKGA
jgi:predicted Holliday junction resolvase-like endonuclease